ncbi:MAG TPA: NADH:ubiquinone reductase (Na(+)-transporting) subunit F, partial [Porticoccaceae bacterium]|nr:NADH:ubiquinone reductase (Na(+)-transporting) subunit F [Porticoccaceae bacterium]
MSIENITIMLGVLMFTGVVLALVVFIMAARSRLVSAGDVTIELNGERDLTTSAGDKLLQTL